MRTIFQALCMPGIIAPFPAVESLRGDAKLHNTITQEHYHSSSP
jgi:hypothetical protein